MIRDQAAYTNAIKKGVAEISVESDKRWAVIRNPANSDDINVIQRYWESRYNKLDAECRSKDNLYPILDPQVFGPPGAEFGPRLRNEIDKPLISAYRVTERCRLSVARLWSTVSEYEAEYNTTIPELHEICKSKTDGYDLRMLCVKNIVSARPGFGFDIPIFGPMARWFAQYPIDDEEEKAFVKIDNALGNILVFIERIFMAAINAVPAVMGNLDVIFYAALALAVGFLLLQIRGISR